MIKTIKNLFVSKRFDHRDIKREKK